ncbi:MAG: DUF4179 domain-containing protein [Alicyclobacillus macrosporangiidus]|uniref:DUF4179 domain-containing protein n=1 Tax=Alicyclobacillus macrosporangiidus TaxID=392015 RepID=UPI0026EE3882|nr:DUF4179 domain-containing protein [Alicyclobacillus macrosporangiidus]MCL6599037.1 DUF4179 domain-containing protein [Alicyclobacillus macrosporangiidus]
MSSRTSLEDRLRQHYRTEAGRAGYAEPEGLWAGIAGRLGLEETHGPNLSPGGSSSGGPSGRGAAQPLRRTRHWAVRGVAGLAGAAAVIAGVVHFAPRWVIAAAASLHGQSPAAEGEVLRGDPGLWQLFQQGAFQPVQLSATRGGVTLTVLDVYADSNRTVVVYRIDGPAAPQGTLEAEPWQVRTDNASAAADAVLSGRQPPVPERYRVTLRDPFGWPHDATEIDGLGNLGYIVFPPLPGWLRSLGVHLTLHVEAVGDTLAEGDPFGPRTFRTVTGPWDIPFVALPAPGPVLALNPAVRSTDGGATLTLTSVRTTASGTRIELSTDGLPADTPENFAQYRLEGPGGDTVRPTAVARSGGRITAQFPPLTRAGAYTLVVESSGRAWRLPWRQPAWSTQQPQWRPALSAQTGPLAGSALDASVYTGTSLAAAARLSGLPVHGVPAGWRLVQVSVTPDFRPPLSGDRSATPYAVQLTLTNAAGVTLTVTETRTLWSLIPASESLAVYRASMARASGSNVEGPRVGQYEGMTTHLWVARTMDPAHTATLRVPILYLYPSWGSIEVAPVPGKTQGLDEAALERLVTEVAQAWWAAPVVTG